MKPSKKKKISRVSVSRRGFLKAAAISAAAASGANLLPDEQADAGVESYYPIASSKGTQFDFSNSSSALQPDAIVNSACQFCNSLCRLKVHLKKGRIINVEGEPEDPVQAGGICVKGPMMTQLVYNRLRLTHPMKRVAGEKGASNSQFEPISWDEAYETIATKFLALRDAGEARAIANKTSGRLPRGTGALVERFFTLVGSPNNTDVGPVCNDAGGNALAWTFGLGNFTNGYGKDGATGKEDLGSAKFLLFLGTNQAETHPITFAYLLRSRAQTKAKLVVVDPRLTPTGAQADEWIAPKPHTDQALVLGMLYHILSNNLHDRAFVQKWVLGFEELKNHLLKHNYTPQWAESVTGIRADKIKQIAEDYARAKPAAIFCNAGISHQLNAFDTYRTLAFLATVTGNIGVNGGGCNFMHNTWPGALNLTKIEGNPPKKDVALPVDPDYFAQSILTNSPYRLKAIMTQGNPLVASSNTNKVIEAFRQLDFYVYTGLFMEEAAYYADIILPVCSGFEMETVYMRRDDRAIRWQKQAVERVGESKPDWEIWIDLAHTMALLDRHNPPQYWTENFPVAWKDYRNLWASFVKHTPGMGGMTQSRLEKRTEPLRWPCPTIAHPGVSTLYLDHPSWYEAAKGLALRNAESASQDTGTQATAALPRQNKMKRFLTPSGLVEIYTPELENKLATAGHSALPIFYTHPEVTGKNPTIEYTKEFVPNPVNPQALTQKVRLGKISTCEVHKDYPLMGTIGRPSVVHFHTVTHWTYTGKQMNGIRLIQIHPQVAQKEGIKDGELIAVESPRGSITGTAQIWSHIRPDTIFIPHTFGPGQKMASELGTPYYEAANVLLNDRYYDNLSGQQAYKCFACRVKKV